MGTYKQSRPVSTWNFYRIYHLLHFAGFRFNSCCPLTHQRQKRVKCTCAMDRKLEPDWLRRCRSTNCRDVPKRCGTSVEWAWHWREWTGRAVTGTTRRSPVLPVSSHDHPQTASLVFGCRLPQSARRPGQKRNSRWPPSWYTDSRRRRKTYRHRINLTPR